MSDDPKWLQWRREGITATDVADAAQGTYGGLYGVVARKLGLVVVEHNAAMDRGHRWEAPIADGVHALTGWFVVGEQTWCENFEDPRWRATVDGFLSDTPELAHDEVESVLEVKTIGVGVRRNVPRWTDQMQWQMLASGAKRGLLAVARIDDTTDELKSLSVDWVEADEVRQEFLISVAERLWSHVSSGTLPEPDEATSLDDVKQVHSTSDGSPVVDLAGLSDDVDRLAALKANIKLAELDAKTIEVRIRDAIGSATRGDSEFWTVHVSAPRNVLTREAEAQLIADRPDLVVPALDKTAAKADGTYDRYLAPVGARVLTLKEKQ